MFPKSPFMGEVMRPARSSLNPRAVLFPFRILRVSCPAQTTRSFSHLQLPSGFHHSSKTVGRNLQNYKTQPTSLCTLICLGSVSKANQHLGLSPTSPTVQVHF